MLNDFNGRSLPNLAPLVALQHLDLSRCEGLQATSLTGLTSLLHVELARFDLPDQTNTGAFLSWLAQQCHMTNLILEGGVLPDLPGDVAAAAFAGLTACSTLQRLTLSNILTPSPWQHIFPAGQLCTALTFLEMVSLNGSATSEAWQRMAAACPSLQQLHINDSLDMAEIDLEEIGSRIERVALPLPLPCDMTPTSELQPLTWLTNLTLSRLPTEHMLHLMQLTAPQKLDLLATP